MSKQRMIVLLTTKKDELYEVGKEYDGNGFIVKSIEFRRDGMMTINPGVGHSYLITLQNPHVADDKLFRVIPYDELHDFSYIEKEAEKKESGEVAPEMKRVE